MFDEHSFPFAKKSTCNIRPPSKSQASSSPQVKIPIISSQLTGFLLNLILTPNPTEPPTVTRQPISSPRSPSSLAQPTEHQICKTNIHMMQTRAKFWKQSFIAAKEPTSVFEASQHEHWNAATRDQYIESKRNGIWYLVHQPTDRRAICCKCMFKIKEIQIVLCKSTKLGLWLRVFFKWLDSNFNETFIPVVKPTTLRVILSVALSRGWTVKQLDINSAFLNGDLKEEVFI